MKYRAYEVSEVSENRFIPAVVEKSIDSLPPGDVLIQVQYSSLNYKDALSAAGNKGVTKNYPHTPGVDAAGIVAESSDKKFKAGDRVIVTGHDLGMNTAGGFGQYIRVPAGWVALCPEDLDTRRSMMLGTAGQTAAMCIERLLHLDLKPEQGPVLVTGASGGVGILAVAILAKLGFEVAASTGKPEAHALLKDLGATHIVDRNEFAEPEPRPLLKQQWAGAVDVVGGHTLANVIKSLNRDAAVAACGLVQSPAFEASVFPFILRGVSLLGVDSAEAPITLKTYLWDLLTQDWMPDKLDEICTEIGFDELEPALAKVLAGGMTGRYLLNLRKDEAA